MNEYVNSCKVNDSLISQLKEEKQDLEKQIGTTKQLQTEIKQSKQQNKELSQHKEYIELNLSEKEKKITELLEN